MKKMIVLVLAVLAGCSTMTPAQKRWTGVAVGVLVVGAIGAHRSDHRRPVSPGCTVQPDGSCR
jgi:hypothetical protein